MADHTFLVSGIHCAGCESSIESGLRRLDGVRRVEASHEDQRVTVRFDERRVDAGQLALHLEKMGFAPVEGAGGAG